MQYHFQFVIYINIYHLKYTFHLAKPLKEGESMALSAAAVHFVLLFKKNYYI